MFRFDSVTANSLPTIHSLLDENDTWVYKPDSKWLQHVTTSSDTGAVLIIKNAAPIGYIQFEREIEDVYSLAIFITKSQRGQGNGPIALKEFITSRPSTHIYKAYIDEKNRYSTSAFIKAGFRKQGIANEENITEFRHQVS